MRIETEVKYEGYINRQLSDIKRFKRTESKSIPAGFKFDSLKGISKEAIEKLLEVSPTSFGQASRIPGISMCDLSLLAVYVERSKS